MKVVLVLQLLPWDPSKASFIDGRQLVVGIQDVTVGMKGVAWYLLELKFFLYFVVVLLGTIWSLW